MWSRFADWLRSRHRIFTGLPGFANVTSPAWGTCSCRNWNCVALSELCRAVGMMSLGQVALDGTRVRANASRRKAMSYARLSEK
jgi:hypothetical protein